MVDANEEFVSIPYTYYKGDEAPVDGMVNVPQRMQLDSRFVRGVVATQIAMKLKEQGIFVWRDGYSLIGGTSKVDKSSGVEIVVDGAFETLTLQAYDAATTTP
ncbi:hypothetical protein BK673_16195 [Pseudomonas fluorescens]|uniref:Uncharacterized protein n=1 Tax=Pseudomonas fluorescens TaxID=294 RepID=A0A423P4D6_PSEFL|nr:hypothetical protein [Pseudomonas fluorescens]ROO08080.1 hypothetical protein BK673_16195 [Pseudomonas fluorescens]